MWTVETRRKSNRVGIVVRVTSEEIWIMAENCVTKLLVLFDFTEVKFGDIVNVTYDEVTRPDVPTGIYAVHEIDSTVANVMLSLTIIDQKNDYTKELLSKWSFYDPYAVLILHAVPELLPDYVNSIPMIRDMDEFVENELDVYLGNLDSIQTLISKYKIEIIKGGHAKLGDDESGWVKVVSNAREIGVHPFDVCLNNILPIIDITIANDRIFGSFKEIHNEFITPKLEEYVSELNDVVIGRAKEADYHVGNHASEIQIGISKFKESLMRRISSFCSEIYRESLHRAFFENGKSSSLKTKAYEKYFNNYNEFYLFGTYKSDFLRSKEYQVGKRFPVFYPPLRSLKNGTYNTGFKDFLWKWIE